MEIINYNDFIDVIIEQKKCFITSTNNPINERFEVYPTLVNDQINIEFNFDDKENLVFIYDSNGNKVISQRFSSNIHLGILFKGMYIVVVQTKKINVIIKKSLKSRFAIVEGCIQNDIPTILQIEFYALFC